jgi:hypothetical protein
VGDQDDTVLNQKYPNEVLPRLKSP